MRSDHKQLARQLKVLSVGTRVRIVQLIKGRALCVNALAARLDVTQGAVSQHLRVMRDAGLVVDEKHGYYVHYRLNEDTLSVWWEEIDKLLGDARSVAELEYMTIESPGFSSSVARSKASTRT